MAVCAWSTNRGLIRTDWTTGDCSGYDYVLLTPTELQALGDLSQLPTLQDIFTVPVAEDLAQMWAIGFSLPMVVYLVSWALGVVVNYINTR